MTETAPRKILMVDDDKFLLDMYTIKFSKGNYEIKSGDSAESALKLIRSGFVPDIVMADIVMPGMDGLEFVTALRKENLAPQAVTIMLTNQGSSEDISKAKNLNVDGYIVKATTIPSEVLNEVERIFNQKKNNGSS